MSKIASAITGAATGFLAGGPVGAVIGAGLGLAQGAAQERATERRERSARRAAREQQRQQSISNAQQAIARQRSIRRSIAEERVQRATIESRAFSGGPEGVGQAIAGDVGSAIGAGFTQEAAAFGISRSQTRQRQFEIEGESVNRFDELSALFGAGQTALEEFGGELKELDFGSFGGR